MILPPLVILDRDGVINHDSTEYIKTPEEWHPIASSIEAIARLNDANIKVGVASNQRGIGRGLFTEQDLAKIHHKMQHTLKMGGAHIDALRFCPALDRSDPDHKPNPGMLLALMKEFNLDPIVTPIYFVGDKISDLDAALNAGCIPILVKTGYGSHTATKLQTLDYQQIAIYDNLNQFVTALLTHGAQL